MRPAGVSLPKFREGLNAESNIADITEKAEKMAMAIREGEISECAEGSVTRVKAM